MWADEVFTEIGKVPRVTLAWRARPDLPEISGTRYGAVLMVFEGDANMASKTLYEDTGVLQFENVDGVDYYWTRGRHLLELLTGEGSRLRPGRRKRAPVARRSSHDAPRDHAAQSGSPPDRRVGGNHLIRAGVAEASDERGGIGMKRGMLLCVVVGAAIVVLGVPGAALAGGGCHSGVTENDATGDKGATVRMVDACFTATVTSVDPGRP